MHYTFKSNEEIIEWLKKNLYEKRFLHSLGCAKCAQELAKKFCQDENKAYLAGLLHDCGKCVNQDEMTEIADKIKLEKEEASNFKILHAPIGAYIANNEFKITDEEILSSIRWHTLGKINMSTFEKIIFLADKIETETRDKEYSQKIYEVLEKEGLDKAILLCYKETIKSLVKRNLKICKTTIDIYNSLL